MFRLITVFLLLILFSSCNCTYKTSSIRQNAIDFILVSSKLEELTNDFHGGYRVSNELIPFYEIGFLFSDQLALEAFPEDNFSDLSNFEIVEDKKLKKLSKNQNSKLQFCFSKIENGYLIVEVFNTPKRIIKRINIPETGQSLAYLFKIKGKSVELIRVQWITYG